MPRLSFSLYFLLFAVFSGLFPGWDSSGYALAQTFNGRIVIPDATVPLPPTMSAQPTPSACLEAQRLFQQQQGFQQYILPLLNNIHNVVATLNTEQLERIQEQMANLENLSMQLAHSLEECQQQSRPETTLSPCDRVPLLESAIQSALEANRDNRLLQLAEAQVGGYIRDPGQIQFRVPAAGTIVNLGSILPLSPIDNLPDPGVNPQDAQLQNLFLQLQQTRLECQQSRQQPGRVP